jgi:hypothetical protein
MVRFEGEGDFPEEIGIGCLQDFGGVRDLQLSHDAGRHRGGQGAEDANDLLLGQGLQGACRPGRILLHIALCERQEWGGFIHDGMWREVALVRPLITYRLPGYQ